jgi:hypothetical protein
LERRTVKFVMSMAVMVTAAAATGGTVTGGAAGV